MKSKSKSFKFKKQVRKQEPKVDVDIPLSDKPFISSKEFLEEVGSVFNDKGKDDDCPCCKAECQCCEHASGRVNYKCTCRCHASSGKLWGSGSRLVS